MLEGLPLDFGSWGPSTFVGFIIIMILTDRLVTRGRLLEKIEEIKTWRAAAEREQTINETNAETIKNYAEAALVTEKVMRTLQERHRISGSELESSPDGGS